MMRSLGAEQGFMLSRLFNKASQPWSTGVWVKRSDLIIPLIPLISNTSFLMQIAMGRP